MTNQEFTTFLLRALGYLDEDVESTVFNEALTLAVTLGMYTEGLLADLNTGQFLRGYAVVAMVRALHTNMIGSETMLLYALAEAGVFTEEDADAFLEQIELIDATGQGYLE